MTADPIRDRPHDRLLQRAVAVSALATLLAASLAGVWMAIALLWPETGRFLGPLTFGRWAPVHMDLQLYGWCSLPAIGLLLQRFLPRSDATLRAANLALALWLGALAAGALGWLAGASSGKLFLDWTGAPAIGFTVAQLFLWSVLAAGWLARLRARTLGVVPALAESVLLALLLGVPIALHLAAQASVYPPINPDSGGATGHSLLASTLGVIGIALVLPSLFRRPARGKLAGPAFVLTAAYLLNWLVHAVIQHGNVSHHAPDQLAGLATLLFWPALLIWWFRHFRWEPAHVPWLQSAGAWALLLVVDGMVLFLPGILERTKFTDALVGHAHLAMAGLLTSLNLLMLVSLAPRSEIARALARRLPWAVWNAACLVMVIALTHIGWMEGTWMAAGVPRDEVLIDFAYIIRLVTGVAMAGAVLPWSLATVRRVATGQAQRPPPGRIVRNSSQRARHALPV